MHHKNKHFGLNSQRGNAMVYILIVVALFGALTFVLARQTDNTESGVISSEQVEIHAGVIQQAAMQLKQAVDQMLFTGTQIADLNFTTPDNAAPFNAPPHMNKIFHPQGGGIVMPRLPDAAVNEISTDPPARWYIGRFNNVEWTPTSAQDVILTAHQLTQDVCRKLNEKLTGSASVPELATNQVNELLIDTAESSAGPNIAFTSVRCPGCFGHSSLCVMENGATSWSFYSIIAGQ